MAKNRLPEISFLTVEEIRMRSEKRAEQQRRGKKEKRKEVDPQGGKLEWLQ